MNPADDLVPSQWLRTIQSIAGALAAGVVVFLAIALFLVNVQNEGRGLNPPGEVPVLSLVALALLAIEGPLAFLWPAIQTRAALRRLAAGGWRAQPGTGPGGPSTATGMLLSLRQTSLIISLAMLEGAALLGCIAFLLEAHPIALGVVAVAVALILVQFPTEGKVRRWLEQQNDRLSELQPWVGPANGR